MRSYLENVKEKFQSKLIIALIEDIEENTDIKDLFALKNIYTLALWMYVLGDKNNALYFANIVSELDLTLYKKNVKGFSDSAASAHYYQINALVLCAALSKETGKLEKAESYWDRYLTLRLETNKWGEPCDGQVARKRWKRNIEKGDLLELFSTKKQSYIDNGNESRAVQVCCELLSELLWMKQAGGSELYPLEELTQLIDEQVKYLRENLEKVKSKYFV
jgi:hypothetical protein